MKMKIILEYIIRAVGIFIILILIDYKRDKKLILLTNENLWIYILLVFIATILIQIRLTK
jgi:hypothetical protein